MTTHICTQHQPTYIFTKALGASQFNVILNKLGIINIYFNLRESVNKSNNDKN